MVVSLKIIWVEAYYKLMNEGKPKFKIKVKNGFKVEYIVGLKVQSESKVVLYDFFVCFRYSCYDYVY